MQKDKKIKNISFSTSIKPESQNEKDNYGDEDIKKDNQ